VSSEDPIVINSVSEEIVVMDFEDLDGFEM